MLWAATLQSMRDWWQATPSHTYGDLGRDVCDHLGAPQALQIAIAQILNAMASWHSIAVADAGSAEVVAAIFTYQ